MYGNMKRLLVAILATAALLTCASDSLASPGTCECHANTCTIGGTGCVKSSACSLGYAPTCRARIDDTICTFLVCTGACDCAQIPGFCETVGGADYCDAGPDTGLPDTGSGDTSVTDTAAGDAADGGDTAIRDSSTTDASAGDSTTTDTGAGDATSGDARLDAPADTAAPDSATGDTGGGDSAIGDSGDTGSGDGSGDTGSDTANDDARGDGGDGDTCVPLKCPTGTRAESIPGECNPYCAQPCGTGEFKCSALPGTECKDGFCVPKCLLTGCDACRRCNLGEGTCVEDPTKCDGGIGDASDSSSDAFLDFDTGTTDATFGDTRDPFVDPDFDFYGTQGGCGCGAPGSAADRAALLAASVALTSVLMARRRRRGSPAAGPYTMLTDARAEEE